MSILISDIDIKITIITTSSSLSILISGIKITIITTIT